MINNAFLTPSKVFAEQFFNDFSFASCFLTCMRMTTPTLKLVVLLINLLFCFAFSNTANAAETVKGRIKIINGTYLLVTKNQIAYTMEFTSAVSEQQIKRLGNGDFASVTINPSPIAASLIYVVSVDYVGLKDLLGTWRSDNGMCYEFSTFTRLYVYAPNLDDECVRNDSPDQFSKYSYFINPDVDAWNMLLSSASNEFFGDLKFTSDTETELQLFDSQTAANLGTIILRR